MEEHRAQRLHDLTLAVMDKDAALVVVEARAAKVLCTVGTYDGKMDDYSVYIHIHTHTHTHTRQTEDTGRGVD